MDYWLDGEKLLLVVVVVCQDRQPIMVSIRGRTGSMNVLHFLLGEYTNIKTSISRLYRWTDACLSVCPSVCQQVHSWCVLKWRSVWSWCLLLLKFSSNQTPISLWSVNTCMSLPIPYCVSTHTCLMPQSPVPPVIAGVFKYLSVSSGVFREGSDTHLSLQVCLRLDQAPVCLLRCFCSWLRHLTVF